jgi:hypothetical protein
MWPPGMFEYTALFLNVLRTLETNGNTDVTRYELVLGDPDPNTGIPTSIYIQSTIKIVIQPQTANQILTDVGNFQDYTFTASTSNVIAEGDKLQDKNGNFFKVISLLPASIGDNFSHYLVTLKLMM